MEGERERAAKLLAGDAVLHAGPIEEIATHGETDEGPVEGRSKRNPAHDGNTDAAAERKATAVAGWIVEPSVRASIEGPRVERIDSNHGMDVGHVAKDGLNIEANLHELVSIVVRLTVDRAGQHIGPRLHLTAFWYTP